MRKSVRLDFSGGLNSIIDKTVVPDKFGTVLDNINLRSGFLRCVKEPIFDHIVSNPSYQLQLSNTSKIFNYRGRWLYSDNWRDYVADYINGIERIYWTETVNSYYDSSTNELVPQKLIEGTQVRIGTPRPTSQPVVTIGTNIVPTISAVSLVSDGGLIPGTYYYAISAEYDNGISSPSNIKSIVVPPQSESNPTPNSNVSITWQYIKDAKGFIIWGRSPEYGTMKRIGRVSSSVLTFTDDGSQTPKGETPSIYFDNSPVAYVYTYERNVNGVTNESGLSPVSEAVQTTNGRIITRDMLSDGYFDQYGVVSKTTLDSEFNVVRNPTGSVLPYYPDISVISYERNTYLNQINFTCSSEHHLTTGDKIVFSGSGWVDPNYYNQSFEVIFVSSTIFAIKNIPAPSSVSFLGSIYTDGISISLPSGNYDSGTYTNLTVKDYNYNNTTATITLSIVESSSGGISTVDSFTVTSGGSGFSVGETIYVSVPTLSGTPATTYIPFLVTDISNNLNTISVAKTRIQISNVSSQEAINDKDVVVLDMEDSNSGAIKNFLISNYGYGYNNGTYLDVPLVSGSSLETRRPTNGILTVSSFFPSSVSNMGNAYDVDPTHQATYATFNAPIGLRTSTLEDTLTFYSFQPPTQVYDSITLNVCRSYSVFDDGTATTSNKLSYCFIEYSIDGGTNWINLVTDTTASHPSTPTFQTINLSSEQDLADVKVRFRIIRGAGSGGGGGLNPPNETGQVTLRAYDVWVDGVYQGAISSGQDAKADVIVAGNIVTSVILTDNGFGYSIGDSLTLDGSFPGIGSGSGFTLYVKSLYGSNKINGVFKAHKYDIYGNPIVGNGVFDIDVYTPVWTPPTTLNASAKWVPLNGYYKTWNLYRTGSTGAFQLVEKIPIDDTEFSDTTSTQYLGEPPTSYYIDNGIFGQVQIDFDIPPDGLQSLTSHYGMLFGVDGNTVRWTPANQPDAWPSVYSQDFNYKPLALASFGTGLVVLCEDAIYVLDGNQPSSMSLSKTQAEDGCYGPHTVQKTHAGLVYLSKRGVMLFNGMNSVCITDNRISSNFLLGPSKLETPVNFWWIPTKLGYFYGNLAYPDGVLFSDTSANRFYRTNKINSPNFEVTSLYHLGKYYLVYTGKTNYEGHTTLCIDLQVEGYPITTLGLKPVDIITNEFEDAYILVDNQGNGSMDNFIEFKKENSELQPSNSFTSNPGLSVWKLFDSRENVPMFFRSGQKGFDNTTERRKYDKFEFYGDGTLSARAYIDSIYVSESVITMAEGPNKPRRFNMPKGNRIGYNIDFELCGDTDRLIVEFTYSDSRSPS